MKWVEVKMRELGVTTHPDYKITFMLDHRAMVTVRTERYGEQNLPAHCVTKGARPTLACARPLDSPGASPGRNLTRLLDRKSATHALVTRSLDHWMYSRRTSGSETVCCGL